MCGFFLFVHFLSYFKNILGSRSCMQQLLMLQGCIQNSVILLQYFMSFESWESYATTLPNNPDLPGIFILLFRKAILLLSAYIDVLLFHSSTPVAGS